MIWEYAFPVIFGLAILVQVIYLLFVFTSLIRHSDIVLEKEFIPSLPSVSVVVAAWNELDNLKELLPLLDKQQYPDFEIILVDDRSSDGTYDYLRTNEGKYKNVKYVHIKELPEHFTAKKYAVTMGIQKASKEVILLTDADCRPMTQEWISQMAVQLTVDTEVVLGFSPYDRFPGWLNSFIRYETFQTALQYFSFAEIGAPFMGVGRNLMYRRASFWENKGFTTHMGLLSGDDDLFVNQISEKGNTVICTEPISYMSSEPKRTFKDWVTQKKRHLSVGKRYKFRDKITIGLLWISFLMCWFFAVPAFVSEPSWFELPEWLKVSNDWLSQFGLKQYEPFTNWMRVVLATFIFWIMLRWLILYLANKKLGRTVSSAKILILDFLYFLYLVIFGIMTLFSNPKKIRWR